jgi:protein SCO1/2
LNRARLESDQRWALLALLAIGVVTVGWWALALWPVPGNPEWLTRARVVCFNAGPDGMPDVSGWMVLIGQPLGMLAFLAVVWPKSLFEGLSSLASVPWGRWALAAAASIAVAGVFGVSLRVGQAATRTVSPTLPESPAVAEHPRLDRPAPALGLVNQRGETIGLSGLRGRPAVVTFAFGHCADICPVVVREARTARDETLGPEGAAFVVITLDPWRDTPPRLGDLAIRWELAPGDHMLGGSVEDVEAVLDAWNVARSRNPVTGDIAHPPLTFLLDSEGTIAFATVSGRKTVAALIARL